MADQTNIADTPVTAPAVPGSQPNPDAGNQPVPGPANQPPQNPSDAAGIPPVADNAQGAPNVPSEEERASQQRIEQRAARNNKVISALGLDPNSDLGEQLEKGLITEDMLRQHVTGRYGPQPGQVPQTGPVAEPTSEDAVNLARVELATAKDAYHREAATGEISIQTNNKYMEAMNNLNDARDKANEAKLTELRGQVTADKQSQQVNENVNAVLSVAQGQPEYAEMSEELRPIVDTVQLSVTGMIADREAQKMGLDPQNLNPQQYLYFAEKASLQLGQLANFYIEKGRAEVRNGIRPTNNNFNTPIPINSGSPVSNVPNPYAHGTIANHKEMANKYMSDNRGVM